MYGTLYGMKRGSEATRIDHRTAATFRRLFVAFATCAGSLAMLTSPALAADDRQVASAEFTRTAPGVSTGLAIEIDYMNPTDPAGKPPAVREIRLRLARPSRIDTGALPACEAGNAELQASGARACPESRLGDGAVTLDTGFPEPGRFLATDLTLLNATNEVIVLFQERQSGARVASRAAIEGDTITTTAPLLPGTPPDGAAVDTVSETFERAAAAGYLTTPKRCPPRGSWRNRLRFTYDDGTVQRVLSLSPCR